MRARRKIVTLVLKWQPGYHFTDRGYSLALWESTDDLDWKLSKHPFVADPSTIRSADGRDAKINSLERPQVLFDNGVPIVRFCAAAEAKDRDRSFNMQISLRSVK